MVNYKTLSAIFVVVAILFAASTGYFIAFPSSSTHTSTLTTTVSGSAVTTTITGPTSSGAFTVNIAYKADVGFYLTNASGFTLYFRATDPGNGSSTCTGSCVSVWPLFYAGTGSLNLPPSLSSSSFGVATRSDGLKQTTYNGYPLYYYEGDTTSGQINGQGKGNFYACCSVVTASSATSTTSGTSSAASAAVAKVMMPTGAYSNSSSLGNLGFYPNIITVVIGVNNTVMWTNNDVVAHTVDISSVPSGAQTADSGDISPGASFSHTFTVAGTYQYHCDIHPWMHGTVIVEV